MQAAENIICIQRHRRSDRSFDHLQTAAPRHRKPLRGRGVSRPSQCGQSDNAFSFRGLDPAALLAARSNLCILGAAGAGKTCLARTLAKLAIDAEQRCIYFPCSRIQDKETRLKDAMYEFLLSLKAVDTEQAAASTIKNADIIILDGCDEAATYTGKLGEDIASLICPSPISASAQIDGQHEIWLPPELDGALIARKTRAGVKLTLREPIAQYDWDRVIKENRGTSFEAPLEELAKKALRRPRLIITSREAEPLGLVRGFECMGLMSFTDEQMRAFFTRWFAGMPESVDSVLRFLEHNPYIKEICRMPITATIVAALQEGGYELPRSRAELYDKRFTLLLDGWDRARGVPKRTKLHSSDKRQLLSRLALRLHLQHRRRFDKHDVRAVCDARFKGLFGGATVHDVVEELRLRDNVIMAETGGEFSLGHLSYQEYLAALAIVNTQSIKILEENMFDSWWRQVAVFYAGAAGDVEKLLNGIQDRGGFGGIEAVIEEMLNEAKYTPAWLPQLIADFRSEGLIGN